MNVGLGTEETALPADPLGLPRLVVVVIASQPVAVETERHALRVIAALEAVTRIRGVLAHGLFTNTVEVETFASEVSMLNNTAAASVLVSNFAPIAGADTYTTLEDVAVTLDVLENDVDSDPLSVSAFTDPIYGTAVLSGTAQLIYTPAQDFHGVDAFTYPVSDSDLTDTASISVTVKPINDAPVIAEGTRVEVSMSEDGVPKPFRLTLHGEDVEDEPLTWSVGAPPLHGTAIVAAGPAVSQTVACTPAVNYHGPDAFPVQVSDGILTDTLTVSVTDAPVGGPDTLVALRKRGSGLVEMLGNASAGALDVLANDTDVDDENRRVSSVGAPSQGGTTGVSAGAVNVIYAPTAAFVGRETFTYTVTDGDLTDTTVVSATVTEGAGGGVSGDTAESGRAVVTTDTGASDAFAVTLEIPDGAAGDENLALVYDDLLDGSSSPPQGYTQAGLNFTLDGYVDGQSVDLGYELQHPLTLTLDYKQADIAEIGPCEQTLALFYRDGDPWVSDGVTIAKHDLDW